MRDVLYLHIIEEEQDEDEKKAALLERVIATEKPGIVYTATHRHAEEIAGALLNHGVKASFYHAGVKAKERRQVEEAVSMHEDQRQFEQSRIEMMRGYAEVLDCWREYLLNYFGEPFEGLAAIVITVMLALLLKRTTLKWHFL